MDHLTQARGQMNPPIRPVRLADEWSETYLGRTARALGIRHPWRRDLETLRTLLPNQSADDATGKPGYGNQLLPGWATLGRGAQIRYCCDCLREQRYIRARWRIVAFEVCTVHGVNLKPGLVEPAITSAYKHPLKRPVHEVDEEDLVAGSMCPTPLALRHASNVWGMFERAVLAGAEGDEVTGPLVWALLSERLLDAVVTSLRGPDYPPNDVPRHEHRALWLQKSGLPIGPHRDGVLTFLLSLRHSAHRRAALACLSRLLGDEERKPTIMSKLPLQELKDRLLAADSIPGGEASGALPRGRHPVGYKSLEATETILGCSSSLLYYLVREGHFKGVQRIKFGRKQYVFVPDEEVERLRRFLATCMTFDDLLRHLAVDRPAYRVLHYTAVVAPIEMGSWRRYRRKDVASLLTRLDDVARPMPALSHHLEPLMGPWLHMSRRVRSILRPVLDELFDGRLPLYKDLAQQGLRAYYVDQSAPARLRWLCTAHYAALAKRQTIAAQLSLWEAA